MILQFVLSEHPLLLYFFFLLIGFCKSQKVLSKLTLLANMVCTLEMPFKPQKRCVDNHTHYRCPVIKTRSCSCSNVQFCILRMRQCLSLVIFVLSGRLCTNLDFLSNSIDQFRSCLESTVLEENIQKT